MRANLYFMLNPGLGIIKIGIAEDVDARRRTLELACGVALEVLAVVPKAEHHEKPLHAALRPSRLIGEWFAPTAELLELVQQPERIPAFLDRMAPQVIEWEREERERVAEQKAIEAVAQARERERLNAIKAEHDRIKAERAARAEARKREREETQRQEVERRQREWAEKGSDAATLYVVRPEPAALATERRALISQTQRGKNALTLGVKPESKRHKTQSPHDLGEAEAINK